MRPELYLKVRAWMLANDPDAAEILQWSQQDLRPPENPQDLAHEVIWIILCAGRSAQAARTIEAKVRKALDAGTPVVEAFGYRAKAAAIERAWAERAQDFVAMQAVLATSNAEAFVQWCGSIPFVGDDTKYQLAKNFGIQTVKPDIHVCRLAGMPDKPRLPTRERFARCLALGLHLAQASGDSVASVDSLIWLACNKGVLRVTFDPHEIHFTPLVPKARSIYAAAGEGETQMPLDGMA